MTPHGLVSFTSLLSQGPWKGVLGWRKPGFLGMVEFW